MPSLTIATVLALLAIVWFFPPTGDFRTGNPFWNGYSTFSGNINATAIESLDSLPAGQGSTGAVLVEVPYMPFTEGELSRLRQFANDGGTVVIMDDYGYGNQALEGLGIEASFSGKPLLDPLFHYKNTLFPRVSSFAPSLNLTAEIAYISMDRSTALLTANGAGVLAWSSSFSCLDLNGDSAKSSSDALGPFPVAYCQKIGSGLVVAVSDPSIAINSMIGVDGNEEFANAILSLNGNYSRVFIDQSHLPREPLDGAKLILAGAHAILSSPAGTLALIAIIIALSTSLLWKKPKTKKETAMLPTVKT